MFPALTLNKILLWQAALTLVLASFRQSAPHRPELHPIRPHLEKNKILICPGFGHIANDYNGQNDLVPSLIQQGWDRSQIHVLNVNTSDWLNVFLRGVTDVLFWKGRASPIRPAFRWYLELVAEEMRKFRIENKDVKVILIGHSAGGWLARAAIGFLSEEVEGIEKRIDLKNVAGVVTLGSPHMAPPASVFDITRGALRITNEIFPGAYFAPAIKYITVMSCSIKGQGLAYDSYLRVCGVGDEVGDGFVPCCAGHLEGSIKITVEDVGHEEYGFLDHIQQWHDVMIEQMVCSMKEVAVDR
jgi:pimeloyl-ACP methyl ester carboxylesterase